MIKLIYLNKFNNYYNRKLIRYDTVNNYTSGRAYVTATDINFNPNDGVTGSQIVNWTYQDSDNQTLEYDWNPDYVLVVEQTGSGMIQSSIIKSRWFVTEFVRTRFGQYNATLKRDVLAEFKNDIINSPAYIEKGVVTRDNTLLYNSEGVNVSQIKTDEIPLYDETNCPWLVAYIAKDKIASDTTQITVDLNSDTGFYHNINTTIENWPYYKYADINANRVDIKIPEEARISYLFKSNSLFPRSDYRANVIILKEDSRNYYYNLNLFHYDDSSLVLPDGEAIATIGQKLGTNIVKTSWWDELWDDIETQFDTQTQTDIRNMTKYHYIKDTSGRIFTVSLEQIGGGVQDDRLLITSSQQPQLFQAYQDLWDETFNTTGNPNNKSFQVVLSTYRYKLVLREQSAFIASSSLSTVSTTSNNALYDILCMPYGEADITCGNKNWISSKEASLATMNAIAKKLTSNVVYDLQLLPYCPVREYIVNNNHLATPNNTDGMIFEDVLGVKAICLVVRSSELEFNINKQIMLTDPDYDYVKHKNNEASDITKYQSDCTSLRLCSPNYNGVFEFNIAKNNGSIEYFNVDMTLKPFNPYIHVNPNFKLFYKKDYNDARGLICGGDFSLGIINNAWNQYEIQNKNYQNIFDREIQNMDATYNINRNYQMLNSGIGIIGAGVGGGIKGAEGGVAGAIAGAALGVSTAGFAAATGLNKAQDLYGEQRDYAIDKFNMNLANIKALPNSITRTSALTANNKLVPFIEVYEPTEEETKAYFNKIYYEGMTIGAIGTIQDYIIPGDMSYVKAKLIMNDSIAEDTHMFNEINNELEKGIYIL